MKSTILLAVGLVLFLSSYSQVPAASQNLKQQASKMASAFGSEDYKTFVSYNYQPMVQATGGAAKTAENIRKAVEQLKTKGMFIGNITLGETSAIVKCGKELQATLGQHTEIKLAKGRIVTTSTLIAISTDNGVNWTFIDTSNKDMATLRKALPNLSPSLIIPPARPPVRYNS